MIHQISLAAAALPCVAIAQVVGDGTAMIQPLSTAVLEADGSMDIHVAQSEPAGDQALDVELLEHIENVWQQGTWRVRISQPTTGWMWDVKTLEWYSDTGCNTQIPNTKTYIDSGHHGMEEANSYYGPQQVFDGNDGTLWGGRVKADPIMKDLRYIGMAGLTQPVRCVRINQKPGTMMVVEKLTSADKWTIYTECDIAEGTFSTCEVPQSPPGLYKCKDGQFEHTDLGGAGLLVAPVCLSGKIAGPLEFGNIFEGPSPMHAVADPLKADTLYFSWTEDAPFGASEAGAEGKVHVTKVRVDQKSAAQVQGSTSFSGFVRAGDIDITDDGVVGTLCAKYVPKWIRDFLETFKHHGVVPKENMGPMMLAVCEVEADSMNRRGEPWRIGKFWSNPEKDGTKESVTVGYWGAYPVAGWFEQRGAGYGWLTYAPKHKTWTTWYGATVGGHTGYAMHTYQKDAPKSDAVYPLPVAGVENREEIKGQWVDHNRWGTGDHQAGSATRYHPLLHDIGVQKHSHDNTYMQQYGLETPSGSVFKPGHSNGRLSMEQGGDKEILEGSLRPCGMDWITAFISDKGNVCGKVTKEGQIATWRVIDASKPKDKNKRMVRLATLGSREAEAKCGSSARFLMGYETADEKRMLVELDGNCNKQKGPFDVTALTTWPSFEEWTTRADGAVVWVTAWEKSWNGKAKFNTWGTRVVDTKKHGALKTWGLTFGATNEAQITVYWPSVLAPSPNPPTTPTTTPTPPTTTTTTTATTTTATTTTATTTTPTTTPTTTATTTPTPTPRPTPTPTTAPPPRRRAPAPTRRRAPAPTRRRAPAPTRRRAPAPTRRRAPEEPALPPANAAQWCGEQCRAKGYCCNDPKIGSNQMISCAQACLMRSQGVPEAEMLTSQGGTCNRMGNSGCRLESKMKNSFSFCNRCSDLTDKCPHGVQSASECDAGASLWTFKTGATDTFVTTTTTATPFFLAQGGQSCTAACQAASKTCDAERLAQAASSVHKCKLIIESLGKTPTKGGQYPDDNSGCTYHPGQTGWYQVMRKNGDAECDAVNSDRSRQRVCACN